MNASQIFAAAHLQAKKTFAGAKYYTKSLTYAKHFGLALRGVYARLRERKAVLALATPALCAAAFAKLDQSWWNALSPAESIYHVTCAWATALNGAGSEWGGAAVATALVADQAYRAAIRHYNAATGAKVVATPTYGNSFYGYAA